MKRLSISILAFIFSVTGVFAQITDMGIIPVGVTLNSILRLNITSGGNLEYSINTMDQYENGVDAGNPYVTNFTVASSVNFDVNIIADAANFTGVEDATNHTMPVENLGFSVTSNGTGTFGASGTGNYARIANHCAVTNTNQTIITGATVSPVSAGGIAQNSFSVNWEFGTQETVEAAAAGVTAGTSMHATSLLGQSLASDRYVVNVFLELVGK